MILMIFFSFSKFENTWIKTIKFKSYPHLNELIKQQELVSDKFEEIFKAENDITVRLEKQ